jgi:hypothetical protein
MQTNQQDFFIWTEIFNCGKIGKIAVDSYLKWHSYPVHVFGTEQDLKWISDDPRVVKVRLPRIYPYYLARAVETALECLGKYFLTETTLLKRFTFGHFGTATLWAYLIKKRKERYMIHFDSDAIFRGNLIDDLMLRSAQYSIVGPIRSYRHNPHGRADVTGLPDLSSTCCFLFDKSLIGNYPMKQLTAMCQGVHNPYRHPVIDFFDPVMFDILNRGGSIFHLDFDDVGGGNASGSRDNAFKAVNNYNTPFKIDFGHKLIHYSAVGSGMNIHFNRKTNIPDSYKQYALDRYALFCKVYYNEDIGVDLKPYAGLIEYLKSHP